MADRDPREVETGYKDGEGKALIAPLVGWPAEDVAEFVVISVDHQRRAGFGASSGITPKMIPALLRAFADGIEQEVER